MGKLKKKSKCSRYFDWKIFATAGAVLSVLFGIWKVDDRYLKAEDGAQLEQRVVQTLQKFQDKLDYKMQRDRMDQIKDQERKLRTQQRATPKNKDIIIDLDELTREKVKVEDRLKELEKK